MSAQTEFESNAARMHTEASEGGCCGAEGARGYLQRGTDQVRAMVEDKPSRSLLLCCLAGVGCGLILARAFGSAPPRSSFDSRSAERFGRRILEKLEKSLPDSVRSRLHS